MENKDFYYMYYYQYHQFFNQGFSNQWLNDSLSILFAKFYLNFNNLALSFSKDEHSDI